MTLKEYLEQAILKIVSELGYPTDNAMVTISNRPDLSDYQSNIAMSLARSARKAPRIIADEIKAKLSDDENFKSITVDGPGFINVSFSDKYLLNVSSPHAFSHKKIVLDYGGPNIAKEMHVGHLRSAIIGESLKRILRFCGDEVVGDVHLGDWGTPMGMLINQLKQEDPKLFESEENAENFEMDIAEISALYRRAAANFKQSDEFKDQARFATFELQNNNKIYRILWQIMKEKSVEAINENYKKLDVKFDVWLGESDTNDLLPEIVRDLLERNIAVRSEGAVIVPIFENGEEKAPLILQKSDNAYTYAITDIATIIQRKKSFSPDAILYVVDARQSEHFKQVFEVARRAGYISENVLLEHIAFGTVNGKDGKPFKTRDGGVMNLSDLIALSETKAKEGCEADGTENIQEQVHQIAIGSLKFQDLKNVRTSNYIFDTENFTKSEGKTGAYIQYAVARINSILEKSSDTDFENSELIITHPFERALVLHLNRAEEYLYSAYAAREPSVICEYIFALAQKFSSFYAKLKINSEPNEKIRLSRQHLICLVRKQLIWGLYLLGIQAPESMSGRK